MIAMLGWFSEARVLASRWKRASRSASCANASGRILIATSRSSFVSRARYTWPIPPSPISAATSYGPRRVPGTMVIRSLLQQLQPVRDDRDRGWRGIVGDRLDEKPLPIASDRVVRPKRIAEAGHT